MNIRIIGAILIFVGCGAFGLQMVTAQVKEEKALRYLIRLLENMEAELLYRLTPLPELCRRVAVTGCNTVQKVFIYLSQELNEQICPDADLCMSAAVKKVERLPNLTRKALLMLGSSLGRFDADGQIKGIRSIKDDCKRELEYLMKDKDVRLRSYQTLSLCAGAALAILLI